MKHIAAAKPVSIGNPKVSAIFANAANIAFGNLIAAETINPGQPIQCQAAWGGKRSSW